MRLGNRNLKVILKDPERFFLLQRPTKYFRTMRRKARLTSPGMLGLLLLLWCVFALAHPIKASDLPPAVRQLQEQFRAGQNEDRANPQPRGEQAKEKADINTVLGTSTIEPVIGEMNNFPQKPERVMEEKSHVVLRALDKITGRTRSFDMAIDEIVKFGSLFIRVRSCQKAPPIEPPESAAFIQIWEKKPGYDPEWIFSNWMFASSPALSAMEHPVYDIWVLDCKNIESNAASDVMPEEKPDDESPDTSEALPEEEPDDEGFSALEFTPDE